MARPAIKTIQILDGKVNLRQRNKVWYAKFVLNNTRLDYSCKTTNLAEAKEIAFDLYLTAKIKLKEGIPFAPRAFAAIANKVVDKLKLKTSTSDNQSLSDIQRAFLERYAIPFFTNTPIHQIDRDKLNKFDEYRATEMGYPPTFGTVKIHISALKLVFDYAVSNKYINQDQVPELINTGTKSEPRKEFTPEEFEKMQHYMATTWMKDEKVGRRSYEKKQVLKNYVSFVYYSGCRPGTELQGLRFSHMRFFTGKDGIEYLGVSVAGKTGRREAIPRHDIFGCLQSIVNHRDVFRKMKGKTTARITLQEVVEMKSDEFVFAYSDGKEANELDRLFTDLLVLLNMRVDPITGENRSLYCLRHSYITNRIMEGEDIYRIAKNVGNSPNIIKSNYDHAINSSLAHYHAGPEPEFLNKS